MKKNILSVLIAFFVFGLVLDANAQSSESDKSAAEKVVLEFRKMLAFELDFATAVKNFAYGGVEMFENSPTAEIFDTNDKFKKELLKQRKISGCNPKELLIDPERPTEVLGNVARVWTIDMCDNGNTMKIDPVLLRKENGVWKVDLGLEESEE